jgi:hypothetical protein
MSNANIDITLAELADQSSESISRTYCSEQPAVLAFKYAVVPLTQLILCAPRNHVLRRPPCGLLGRDRVWEDEYVEYLEKHDLYLREEKASGLRSRSLIDGLVFAGLPRLQGSFLAENPNWHLWSWFTTFCVPNEWADDAIAACNDWFSQLEQHCFIEVEDSISGRLDWWSASLDELRARNADWHLFESPWSHGNLGKWTGAAGVTEKMRQKVRELERNGVQALKLDACAKLRLAVPKMNRSWFSKKAINARKRFATHSYFTQESIADLDRVFCQTVSLVRAIDDPGLFSSCHELLHVESASVFDDLPITQELESNPIRELEKLLAAWLVRYPVLRQVATSPSQYVSVDGF